MTHSSETEVLLHPLKKWIFGPKRARFLAQIWHFWLNISIFVPFGPMPDQKTMGARCLGVFSVTWVPKVLLPPIKIRIFGPKTAIFAPKSNMLSQAFIGLAGSFDALLIGWLVVVVRGLYLARHLTTL